MYGIEKRFIRRDSAEAWVNVTVSVVRDSAGKPRYFIAAAEDIAARKAVEQELRDAVRARDEFLHIASHELRTPLTSLRLLLESLGAVARMRRRQLELVVDRAGELRVVHAMRREERVLAVLALLVAQREARRKCRVDFIE